MNARVLYKGLLVLGVLAAAAIAAAPAHAENGPPTPATINIDECGVGPNACYAVLPRFHKGGGPNLPPGVGAKPVNPGDGSPGSGPGAMSAPVKSSPIGANTSNATSVPMRPTGGVSSRPDPQPVVDALRGVSKALGF